MFFCIAFMISFFVLLFFCPKNVREIVFLDRRTKEHVSCIALMISFFVYLFFCSFVRKRARYFRLSERFLPPLSTVSGTCKDGAQRVHASVWSSHTAHELGRGGASAGMGRPM